MPIIPPFMKPTMGNNSIRDVLAANHYEHTGMEIPSSVNAIRDVLDVMSNTDERSTNIAKAAEKFS